MASKHTVFGLTKTAAVEYGKYGIRVKAVSSGAARTETLIDVLGSEEALERMGEGHRYIKDANRTLRFARYCANVLRF